MKRLTAILLILLVLLGTAACTMDGVTEAAQETAETTETSAEENGGDEASAGETDPPQTEASASDAEDASPASDTDAVSGGDEQTEEAPPESVEEVAFDYTALTADDCVEDAWPEEGVLPHITLDCQGAEDINAAIDEAFAAFADDPMCIVYYQYFKNEQVLSILMVLDYQTDYKIYTPYNLDLSTGQEMTPEELMDLFGVTQEEMSALELELLGQEFEYQYGGLKDSDEAFYQQQYELTIASENADTDRLWIGGDGQLYFVGRIYAMAGADSYEYIMGSGLTLE